MTSETKNWIIAGMTLIIFSGVFYLGYSRYPVWNPLPVITKDTVFIHDTTYHVIVDSFPAYKWKTDSIKFRDPAWMDSVINANRIDTNRINDLIKKYYSINYYYREWEDSLVQISLEDMISENRPVNNNFKYKLLKPTVVIDNSITTNIYTKYIYAGGSITIPDAKYSNIGIYAALPRNYYGLSYIPFQRGIMFTAGFKLIKMK